MTDYQVDIVRPYTSGAPEDIAVNTLHYEFTAGGDPVGGDFDDLRDAIASFFNDTSIAEPTQVVRGYLGQQLSTVTNACEVRVYEIPATPGLLGSPVAVRNWTLGAVGGLGDSLPAEVAMVLSYNAILTDIAETEANPTPPPATIRPRARRRGRMYIGPLNSGAMETTEPGPVRPLPLFATTLRESANDYLVSPSFNWGWRIFSREDWVARGVVAVSTDDAFDTIRGRGVEPTARVSLGF